MDICEDLYTRAEKIGIIKILKKLLNERRYKFVSKAWNGFFKNEIGMNPNYKSSSCLCKRKIDNHNFGINIFGFFDTANGLGEAARRIAKVIKYLGIPTNLINIEVNSIDGKDNTFRNFSQKPIYNTNLIVTNPDYLQKILKKYQKFLENRYNIAYWFWETSDLPERWCWAFKHFDEIWTSSDFCNSVISLKSTKPVIKIPVYMDLKSRNNFSRRRFNLQNEYFRFLFIYDSNSYCERKNPLGILKSYQQAFKNNEKVQLIIKTTKSSIKEDGYSLKEYIKEHHIKNVKIIEEYLSREELINLIRSCDCYLSLHRGEGLGLTIMEAMFFGKPTIVTGYSGNLDFTNINTSFLVKYKLIKIKEHLQGGAHYRKGDIWAEPNINDASEKMKYVYDNPIIAKKIGSVGEKFIKKNHNIKIVSQIISKRLNLIKNIINKPQI